MDFTIRAKIGGVNSRDYATHIGLEIDGHPYSVKIPFRSGSADDDMLNEVVYSELGLKLGFNVTQSKLISPEDVMRIKRAAQQKNIPFRPKENSSGVLIRWEKDCVPFSHLDIYPEKFSEDFVKKAFLSLGEVHAFCYNFGIRDRHDGNYLVNKKGVVFAIDFEDVRPYSVVEDDFDIDISWNGNLEIFLEGIKNGEKKLGKLLKRPYPGVERGR